MRFLEKIKWQEKIWSFPNNYNVALKKLNMLKQQLKRDPVLRKKYEDIINTNIEKGYTKKLSREEWCKVLEKTWYLPHQSVFNKNKPKKFQMFFDAAAEYNSNGLNKAQLFGPDLLNDLMGVMLRFCNYRAVFSEDIRAMYHQVRVKSDDADALRYTRCWCIYGRNDSSSCENYSVRRTASDHGKQFDEAVAECVKRSLYMDDLFKSVETEEQTVSIIKQLIKLIGKLADSTWQNFKVTGKMHSQNFSHSTVTFDKNGGNIQRSLGIHWNATDNNFFFSSKIID